MTTNQVLTKWVSKICKCRKVSCKRIFGTEGALIASLGQPHYLKRQKDNTFGFAIICICICICICHHLYLYLYLRRQKDNTFGFVIICIC